MPAAVSTAAASRNRIVGGRTLTFGTDEAYGERSLRSRVLDEKIAYVDLDLGTAKGILSASLAGCCAALAARLRARYGR
jgi:hypothetical protein